jgi:hypothetical protein
MPAINTPIVIRGFEPLASIEPADGTSQAVLQNGKYFLSGLFRLKLAGVASEAMSITPTKKFEVAQSANNQWYVKDTPPFDFEYGGGLKIQPHPAGPWLRAAYVRLTLNTNTHGLATIALGRPSVSLVGHENSTVAGVLFYPSSEGVKQALIGQAMHPGLNVPGFFVRAYSEGFAFFCKTYNETSTIDPLAVANFELLPGNDIVFHINVGNSLTAPAPLRILNAPGASNAGITLHKITKAALPNQGDDPDLTFALTDVIEAAEGWMSVVTFSDKELSVRRLHDNAALAAALPTQIFASRDRMSFHLPLPRGDGSEASELAQFLYQDAGLGSAFQGAARPRERHYGLRIRGLGSTRTAAPVLDANVVRVGLQRAAALVPKFDGTNFQDFGTFEFEAGRKFKLPLQSVETRSILVPKPDPGDSAGQRILEVPAGIMTLQCVNSMVPSASAGTIIFSTADELLQFDKPQAFAPPTGTSGRSASASFDEALSYDRWMLARTAGNDSVLFDATDAEILPKKRENWLNTENGWESVAKEFRLPEYPGAAVHIDGPSTSNHLALTGLTTNVKTSVTTAFKGDPKEKIVYTAFCAYLGYKLIKPADDSKKKPLPESHIAVIVKSIDPNQPQKWVKDNGLDRFVVAYEQNSEDLFRGFIDDNKPSPEPDEFVWPFAMGLAIFLWKKDGNRYAPDLARDRKADGKPGILFDFSNTSPADPAYLNWNAADWEKYAKESPNLWPVLAKAPTGKLDPTHPSWRGIMFRDLALTFPVPPEVQEKIDKYPFLKKLYNGIENHLLLDYGWKDETGSTWSGGFKNDAGESMTPDSWKKIFAIKLISFGTKGSAGKVVGSEGTIRVEMPFIHESNHPENYLSIDGTFAINITDGVALDRIEIVPTNPGFFTTKRIPGFEKVTFKRFLTDLRSGRVDLTLEANSALKAALPCLAGPIDAAVAFDFSGDLPGGAVSMALNIPTEIHTNLFGKWQASVQGLRLVVNPGGTNELRIRCRINLGLPAFVSVEGDVIVTLDEHEDWHVSLQMQRVGGEIAIGDWSIAGEFSWADPAGNTAPVKPGDLSTSAKDRDLWGELEVRTGKFFGGGKSTISLRIGNRGELSFWIGMIKVPKIPFGVGSLEEPVLLLAHHADRGGNELRKAVMSAAPGGLVNTLRPGDNQRGWLAEWQPSDQIGLLIAASGYLNLQEQVAGTPEKKDEYLTSLLFTDSGLIRIDAFAKFLKTITLKFAIAVDLQKKLFRASIHAPTLKYPSEQSPEFEISGGVLTLAFGFDGKIYFETKVGWPELKQGNTVERNWDDCVKVVWDNMIPINTFWGGFRAVLDSSSHIGLGFALRAGWTKSYSVGGSVAGGKAELGVAVGGVVEFKFQWASSGDGNIQLSIPRDELFDRTIASSRTLTLALLDARRDGLSTDWQDDALVADSIALIEQSIAGMNLVEVSAHATLYADVWGSASVQFLGITIASISVHGYARLQVCLDVLPAPKVTRVYAVVGFEVSVRIGCFSYSAHASIDIYLKDGPCNALGAFYAQLLGQPALN